MARAYVARELEALGGTPGLREGFVTDNGNLILDVHGLSISDPVGLERTMDRIRARGHQWPVCATWCRPAVAGGLQA